MPFTLPVAFFSQDSSTTTNYTVTYSIAPDVGTFSSTSSLSQDGTKSISADGITFTSNNSNIVADCAKIQLDTDRDEYRDVTVTLTITDGIKSKTVSKVLTGISAFSVSNLNQTIFTNEDVSPTITTMVITDGSDTSATGDVTVTITNNNTTDATLSSSAGTYNSTTGVYTLTDSIANVNTALAALAVNLTANFSGDISLTTAFNDTGSVHTASGLINITVVSVNDAPTWSNVVNYDYHDGASAFAFNGPDVADVDGDVITMTAALQDSIGTLSSSKPGVTQNNNQTLIATGLSTTINTVLDNLQFSRTGTGQSSIIFYANDGTANVNQTSTLFYGETIGATINATGSVDTTKVTGTYHFRPSINATGSVTGIVKSDVVFGNTSISATSSMTGPSVIFSEHRFSTNINATNTTAGKVAGTYHFDGDINATGSVTSNLALQNVHFGSSISATSTVDNTDLLVLEIVPMSVDTINATGTVTSVQVRPCREEILEGITSSSSATVSLDEFARLFNNSISGVLDQIDKHFNTYELTTSGIDKKIFSSGTNTYAAASSKSITGVQNLTFNMSVSNTGNHIGIKFPLHDADPTFGKVEIYNGTGASDSAGSYSLDATFTSTDDNASNPWPNRVMSIKDDIAIFTHDDGTTHRWYKATKGGGSWSSLSSGLTISDLGADARYAVSPDGSKFVQVANISSSTLLQYHENGVKVGEIATSNLPSSGTNYAVDKLSVLDDGTIFANMPTAGEVVRITGSSSPSVAERVAHGVTTGVANALLDMHVADDGKYLLLLVDDDSPDVTLLQVYYKATGLSTYSKIHEESFSDNRTLADIELATTRTQDDNLNAVIADIPSVGKRLHK